MRHLSLLICTLLFLNLNTSIIAQVPGLTSTTRAVCIGISDYQSEDIPDLAFADRDAKAFAEWLILSSTDSTTRKNVSVLTNKEATNANIILALTKLKNESKPGDKVFIYFSGHGDVELLSDYKNGYLLGYDSPPVVYAAGALAVSYLNDIIASMSNKKVRVILITDACRSGKLTGGHNGSKLIAKQLEEEIDNVTKILSCEADEVSLEGTQWGGGRGVFSYYLLLGLSGLADKNNNLEVNLREINRYLDDNVHRDAQPISQNPKTVGKKRTKIAFLNDAIIEKREQAKLDGRPVFAGIEFKGIEDFALEYADSSTRILYRNFNSAIKGKNLLEPKGISAYDFYEQYITDDESDRLKSLMKLKLSTALQNDAQQVINAYLKIDPTELQKRHLFKKDYAIYPLYLKKAAELLGADHFYYNTLMAKLNYFNGLIRRLEADNSNAKDSLYSDAIRFQEAALKFDQKAPYIFNELGVLYTRLKESEKAKSNYTKASKLAPQWALPYINYSIESYYSGSPDTAKLYGEKALKLMPDYPELYNLLAWINADFNRYNQKTELQRKGVELKSDYLFRFNNSLTGEVLDSIYQPSIALLEKSIKVEPSHFATQYNLGLLYYEIKDYEKSEHYLQNAIQIDSTNMSPYIVLGSLFKRKQEHEKGVDVFQKGIDILIEQNEKKEAAKFYNSLGLLYEDWGDNQKAIEQYYRALDLWPTYIFAHSNLGTVYRKDSLFEKAEHHRMRYYDLQKNIRPASYKLLGDLYLDMKRYKDAEWMYLKTLEVEPKFQYVKGALQKMYKERAYDLYINKNVELADQFFQNQIQLDTNNAANYRSVGYTYRLNSETAKSENYYLKALALSPESRLNYTNLGMLYYDMGDPEKGQAIMDTGYIKTNSSGILYFKWYMHLYENDLDAASKVLTLLKDKSTGYENMEEIMDYYKNGDYLILDSLISKKDISIKRLPPYIKVRIKTKAGKYEEAARLLKKNRKKVYLSYNMIQRDSLLKPLHGLEAYQNYLKGEFPAKFDQVIFEPVYYPEHCLKLAAIYKDNKEYDRANKLREKAAEIDSTNYTLQYSMGQEYRLHSLPEKAEYYLQKAIALKPEDPSPYWDLTWVYFEQDKMEAAHKILDDAILLWPDSSSLYYGKALLYTYKGSISKAQPLFEKLIIENAAYQWIWEGIKEFGAQNFEAADTAFEKAAASFPDDVEIMYLQCLTKTSQGQYNEALNYLEKALEIKGLTYNFINTASGLSPIKNMLRYKKLMQQHFPEK